MSGVDQVPAPDSGSGSFSRKMREIGDLVSQMENRPDPQFRELARRLTRALLDVHREGLGKVWQFLEDAGETAQRLRETCLGDPLVSQLLVLHDLHPVDRETRVIQALVKVRPHLHAHGGDVSLIAIAEDMVHLRLVGQCDGCRSAARTMQDLVETALYETAADIAAVVWDNDDKATSPAQPGGGFVPLEALGRI